MGRRLHRCDVAKPWLFRTKGNGTWGVYLIALMGLIPCLMLHLKQAPSAGFWQAAWVTSTFFGFGHTGNNGENWIGIFAASAIGFVFCVSVWVTGSAWWAIGCHTAWDGRRPTFMARPTAAMWRRSLPDDNAWRQSALERRYGRSRGQSAGVADVLSLLALLLVVLPAS